jgi:hypothetical protein
VDPDSYETNGMRVNKVSILVDYSVICPRQYGIEEEFTVGDFIAWGERAVFDVIDFHGGIHPKIEYDEELELYRVSYTQDPKYRYEDASAMIEDPDDDGNFPIVKGRTCDCKCGSTAEFHSCPCICHKEDAEEEDKEYDEDEDEEAPYTGRRFYLVSGELQEITLTYHA